MKTRFFTPVFALLAALGLIAGIPAPAAGGLITTEGPTGMFLNPMAEVTPQKTLNIQACWLFQNEPEGSFFAQLIMVAHTLPTKTELGFLFDLSDFAGEGSGTGVQTSYGGFIRQLVLSEGQFHPIVPAFAIGSTVLASDGSTKTTGFFALKKTLTRRESKVPIRAHLGLRYIYSALEGAANKDDVTGYVGLEFSVLKNLSLIGEVNTKTVFNTKIPFAAGLQYYIGKFGISLATMQFGTAKGPGLYFGIGYPFTAD